MTALGKRVTVSRSFITSDYLPNSQNFLVPGKISKCPPGEETGGYCHVISKGWRRRKCGPFDRLKKCICLIHLITFTIYPIGMAPYMRRSLAIDPFLFAAVLDASKGIKWPEVYQSSTCGTFKTQKRHLSLWENLVGVAPDLPEAIRLNIAILLGIPNISIMEQSTKIREGPITYKDRARIVMDFLRPKGAISAKSFLLVGHALEMWGRPITNLKDVIPLLHFSTDRPPPNLSPP